jgi:tetratricopeptide (TPR) repeat protein
MRIRQFGAVVLCLLFCSGTGFAQRPSTDPRSLIDAGTTALKEQRFGDALDAFAAASKLLPRDGSLCFAAGVAAFRLGRNRDAEDWFERALKLDPNLGEAGVWLAEVLYRGGRLKEAIAALEDVQKRSPATQGVEERLREWRKETQLQDRFYESRGAHFSVLFEGPADEMLARRVVEHLETAYWRIGSSLTAYPPNPVTVVLYTTEQFRDITRMPAWTAAAYDGRIRVPIRGAIDQTERLDRVLAHEYVHAVVAMLGGRNVPTWLNEGLAEVFGNDGTADAEKALARTTTRPPLKALEHGFTGLSDTQAHLAYAYSARAVKRMIDLRGAPAVVMLLQDLARGAEFASAFQQRIFMRYEEFDAMVARE